MKRLGALLGRSLPACVALALRAVPASAQELPAPPPATDPADFASTPVPATPPKYDLPPPSTRWNVLLTGLAVTGVSYGAVLGSSYIWPDAPPSDELRVPLAGPWMAIAHTGCPEDEPGCSKVWLVVSAIFIGIDGALQAGGLGIALESAFMPTASSKPRKSEAPTVRPVPVVTGRNGVGLGVAGTF